MIHVTTQARDALHEMLMHALSQRSQRTGNGASLGFRIVPAGGEDSQLGLALDEPRPGDSVVEHDGRSVLIVDHASAELLTDLTLDVAQTEDGPRLALREADVEE